MSFTATLHSRPFIDSSDHSVSLSVARHWLSIGLVTGEQSSVDRLHTARACQAAHKPIINATHVVSVHAGEVAQGIAYEKLDHADHTLPGLLAPVIHARGQVLNKPNAFSDLHLLLFSQLRH